MHNRAATIFFVLSVLFLLAFSEAYASCSDHTSCGSCTNTPKCVWCTQHNETEQADYSACVKGDLTGPDGGLKCKKFHWRTCKIASNSLQSSQSYVVLLVLCGVILLLLIIFTVFIIIICKRKCKCCVRAPKKKKAPPKKTTEPQSKPATIRVRSDEDELHRTTLRNCVNNLSPSPSTQAIMQTSPSTQTIAVSSQPTQSMAASPSTRAILSPSPPSSPASSSVAVAPSIPSPSSPSVTVAPSPTVSAATTPAQSFIAAREEPSRKESIGGEGDIRLEILENNRRLSAELDEMLNALATR